ncbi:methyltransferase domain-containing protein [Arthrobacter cryoconiti]|uniref:Methyltransferase domain-containing protein n=1 Tax=Arthrobacter cryoconiti TaxID=748907 RepID=A0ABV8R0S7_9MICC|nr:methyltransferase domain-containing protein [Arthrobacter cryoconiti]MCC9067978.1 methyltransferase domain-containing protein [Arthrobacter cryoconiti]
MNAHASNAHARNGSGDVYTHGHHESVLRSHLSRTAENCAAYLLPYLQPGMRVLDIGSGPGTITTDFARLVAPGQVVGMDRSPDVVAAATLLATDQHLENLSFTTGDVYAMDFAADTFDVVHAHQLLQHVSDPVAALREMRRVARTGGVVAVRDADFHAMSWYPQLPAMDEWMDLYQQLARHNDAEPDAGRRLIHWAHAAGFTDVAPSSNNWLYATTEQRAWLAGVWSDRVEKSAFAEQAIAYGLADNAALARIAAGWREWGQSPDGWFVMPNGQIIARA